MKRSPFSSSLVLKDSSFDRMNTGAYTQKNIKNQMLRMMNASFLALPISKGAKLPVPFPTDPSLLKDYVDTESKLFPSLNSLPKRSQEGPTQLRDFYKLGPWFEYMKKTYIDSESSNTESNASIVSAALKEFLALLSRQSEELSSLLKNILESYSKTWHGFLAREKEKCALEVMNLQTELNAKRQQLDVLLENNPNHEHPADSLIKSITSASFTKQNLVYGPTKKEILGTLRNMYSRIYKSYLEKDALDYKFEEIGKDCKIEEFPAAVYEDFVKENQLNFSEMKLKNFLLGCLKYSNNEKISSFLRLVKLGHLVSRTSFSKLSAVLYLKCYEVAQHSMIDFQTARKCVDLCTGFLSADKIKSILNSFGITVNREILTCRLLEEYEYFQFGKPENSKEARMNNRKDNLNLEIGISRTHKLYKTKPGKIN